jgi:hypothetical protein
MPTTTIPEKLSIVGSASITQVRDGSPDVEFPTAISIEIMRFGSPPLPGVVTSGNYDVRTRLPRQAAVGPKQETFMRTLISALAMAGVVAFSLAAYAADEPYTAKPAAQKPGRAIDEDTVKSGGPSTKPGRAIEEGTTVKKAKKPKEHGRAIDDGSVKSGPVDKPGRAIEEGAVKSGPVDKPGRAIEEGAVKSGPVDKPGRAIDDGTVKSGGATDKPGRAIDDGTVKAGGATDKPGRTIDSAKKKSKKAKKPQS